MIIRVSGYQPKLSPYVLAYTTLSTLRISRWNSSIIHTKQAYIHWFHTWHIDKVIESIFNHPMHSNISKQQSHQTGQSNVECQVPTLSVICLAIFIA